MSSGISSSSLSGRGDCRSTPEPSARFADEPGERPDLEAIPRFWNDSSMMKSTCRVEFDICFTLDRVVDRQFAEADLAELYDLFHPWEQRGDFDFYLPMVMSAGSVLDVGCGTGLLLHRARDAGHIGWLCGLDPAAGMLGVARKRSDIEWILGELASISGKQEFDMVVMTGHAFQVLVEDQEVRALLAVIRSVLTEQGRFAFETRNPLVRAWESWTPDDVAEITNSAGAIVRMRHEVETPIAAEVVRFTTTFDSPTWEHPRVSRSALRFLDAGTLSDFLSEAGLAIEEQFGDWDRQALVLAD
jgi:SAM-dependent methyltransferase